MASKFSLLSIGAILAAAPLGYCHSGQHTIAGVGPVGLFGIPSSEYISQDKANATGTITFGRYSLNISVKADVLIPDEDSEDNSTMASVISLGLDSPPRNQTHCVAIYHALSANISAASIDLSSQDGYGCDRMLTEDCVSGLLSAATSGTPGECHMPEIPRSCTEQYGDMSGAGFPVDPESEQILYQHGTAPAAPGDETLWTAAATRIWTVFVTSYAENGSTFSSETYLNCLRPDTFKEGTIRPSFPEPNGTEPGGDDPTGTGTTGSPTPSPTNAASHPSLTIAVAMVGLAFNAAMLFM